QGAVVGGPQGPCGQASIWGNRSKRRFLLSDRLISKHHLLESLPKLDLVALRGRLTSVAKSCLCTVQNKLKYGRAQLDV
ncbi:hypothetical protein KUCAC02_004859, partial [Chaenocephalus aceratus]